MTGTLESDQAIWLAIIHKFTSSFTISNFLFLALQKRNKHFSTAWINPYHSFISRNKTPSWVATVHPSAKSAMSAAQALVSMATPFQVTERKRPQGERARENSFSETPNDLEIFCCVLQSSQSPACGYRECFSMSLCANLLRFGILCIEKLDDCQFLMFFKTLIVLQKQ